MQTNEIPLAIVWRTNPLLGLFAIVASFVIAISMVPLDCQVAGAMRLPAIVFSIGLLISQFTSVLAAPKSAFHALNVVAAAPVYWLLLDMVQGAYPLPGIDPETTVHSLGAIGLFSSGVWLGGLLSPMRFPVRMRAGLEIQLSAKQLLVLIWIAFFLALLRFAIPAKFDFEAIVGAFGGSRWEAPWARGAMGGWDAFLDHFAYFGYVLPVLTTLLARKIGWLNRRAFTAICLTGVIASLLSIGGGRRVIGVLVGSGMVVWFLSNPLPRFRSVLVVGFVFTILLLVMQVILLYRNDGLSRILSGDIGDRMAQRQYLHVDDNFLRLSQLTVIIPAQHPHVTWRWLIWVGSRPVPRVLWPGKPIDPGFSLPEFLGAKGVSYSSSIVGELYLAFGFPGCLFGGVVLGRCGRSLAYMLERNSSTGGFIVYGIGTLALFAGVRSGIDLILMSYGIVGWFIVVGIYRKLFVHESNGLVHADLRDGTRVY
ncbi:O-antigen polymerase [Rubripirellula reticaptiva]|uniref:Uncharacterized protein n=1 Tax=Rubripirellula reticaptiva TaxID=2528013 RepID=A0A5C6F1T6_9BACT|nr:O-antigen polymerase [Rubripirellula reticaptiva]TWU55212.1 hypothetical protein Poly59_15090 [Rubripirellula reticaptiva]